MINDIIVIVFIFFRNKKSGESNPANPNIQYNRNHIKQVERLLSPLFIRFLTVYLNI